MIGNIAFLKIKDGDIRSFEELFRTYYEPLCRYAAGFTGNMDAAEEIVQDLFYTLWKERSRLGIVLSVKSYLYGAVRNNALQYLEHLQVKLRYREAITSNTTAYTQRTTPEDNLEYKELQQQISRIVKGLPDRQRKIFCMHRFGGKKYAEIASELSLSIKTVEAEISRALDTLKKNINR